MPYRSATALSLALLVVLVLAACSSGGNGYGGTAVITLLAEPAGLNPVVDRDTAGNVIPLLFSSLVALDSELAPVPDLAESWEVSADGIQWTFHLRKGVKFHDGVELSSRDVLYTLRTFSDPAVSPRLSQLFGVVEAVDAPTLTDVRITLRSPYAPILNLLTVEILPAHLLENGSASMEAFRRSPVGTGPFKLEEWKDGEITLAAFRDYYSGRPYLDSVVFRSFADRRKAWSELMQGKVDLVPDLEADDYAVIKDDARFQVLSYPDVFYFTVLFNLDDPLTSEPVFREAVDLALDREDIIQGTLGGAAVETTGPFRPGTWPYDPALAKAPHDPKRAKELLASLGWKDEDNDGALERQGKELVLGLLVDRGDTLKVDVAQRIKWQLFGVGIKVELEFLTPQEMLGERLPSGRFQSALLQFNAAGDPDTFTYLFWHSHQIGASNLAGYRNAQVDRLIEQGRVESDVEKRVEIYRSIHRELARDRPAVFLFVPTKLVGMSSRLEGIQSTPTFLSLSAATWKIRTQSARR